MQNLGGKQSVLWGIRKQRMHRCDNMCPQQRERLRNQTHSGEGEDETLNRIWKKGKTKNNDQDKRKPILVIFVP